MNITNARKLPKSKPSGDPREWLNKKKKTFREGDGELLRTVHRKLKMKLRKSKEVYRAKLEPNLLQKKICKMCSEA